MSSTNHTTNLGLPQWTESDIPSWNDISSAFALIDTLVGTLAPKYDATSTYAVGDYVQHDGGVYKCKTAISSAEAWNSAKWDAVVITSEMKDTVSLSGVVKYDANGTGITNTQYSKLTIMQ